jgi:hypothetical protein
MLFVELDLVVAQGFMRPTSKIRAGAKDTAQTTLLAAKEFKEVRLFDDASPATDLLGLFCRGGIHIRNPVRNCAWIAAQNAFGRKTVTATASIEDSLFLWFGINWPFADYNAHFDPANQGRNWLDNAQMWLDCKGGGQGTRFYLTVETNYGNPGPGVVLENCKGMALYHGATERGSSQGPGVYWLKNCENVQVGLRRIFPGSRGGGGAACPSHDITVEGGRGNILHLLSCFGNAYQETCVNSDPELLVWGASFDYEATGLDAPNILKFCSTPFCNMPEGKALEETKQKAPEWAKKWVAERNRKSKLPDTPENVSKLEELILRGRDVWHPINARHETTFQFGKDDLTGSLRALSGDRKLPPPPSIPATDAPRLRRPIAFTQAPDFGKALLDAGADPTGEKPSDDAFSTLMFGMKRGALETLFQRVRTSYERVNSARESQNKEAETQAWQEVGAAYDQIHPFDPKAANSDKKRRLDAPRLDIPPGTFLLTRPILLLRNGSVWGAGPDKTVLKAKTNDFAVLEQHTVGTVANLAVDGGRAGLAITGADHHENAPATLKSYIAGQDYYNFKGFIGQDCGEGPKGGLQLEPQS